MKVAIISDIHANVIALKAVLKDIEEQQVDSVYCVGDLVGYAPFPNEVIDLIKEKNIPTVMGNYEPLCAVYKKTCLNAIEKCLIKDVRKVIDFYPVN